MPERIQAVGYHSCVVADLVRGNLLDLEASVLPGPLQEKTMARWIIFDRCTDLLTPLMSQLTLEGRLDEITDTGARTGWLPPERDSGAPLPYCSQACCARVVLLQRAGPGCFTCFPSSPPSPTQFFVMSPTPISDHLWSETLVQPLPTPPSSKGCASYTLPELCCCLVLAQAISHSRPFSPTS